LRVLKPQVTNCRHTTTLSRGMEAASWKDRKIVANSNVHSFISSSNIQLKIGTEMTTHQSEFTTTRNLIYRTVPLQQRSIFSSSFVINLQARYAVLFLKIVGSAITQMTVLDSVSMRSASSSSNHWKTPYAATHAVPLPLSFTPGAFCTLQRPPQPAFAVVGKLTFSRYHGRLQPVFRTMLC